MPETKKHTYESSTLGLPPLKMVLVHAHNSAQDAVRRTEQGAPATPEEADAQTTLDREKVVRRLIAHLEKTD